MSQRHWVYIISNRARTTLYIGVTHDIERRMYQHRNGLLDGFAKKYNLKHLVYYEEHNLMIDAIEREKQLKKWKRAWKDRLVSEQNPHWKVLSDGWFES